MGVWSSISFCSLHKKRMNHVYFASTGNSGEKQILNIDSNSFSTTVLRDVKEIRIQESYFENDSVQPDWNDKKERSLDCPEYFEYSMGGNLKFYKEHIQQDFELERKLHPFKNPGQRLRNSSHSDNDSEPESLRYSRKPQEKVVPHVNTITEEPELSFDDYSSIYQPEFMLNINSQSLIKEMPKHLLEEKVNEQEMSDERKEDNKITFSSQNLIRISSHEEKLKNDEVRVVNKSAVLTEVKLRDTELSTQNNVFDYHSSLTRVKKNSKLKENQKTISVKHKNQECIKNKRIMKPRRSQAIQSSESNVKVTNDTLPKNESSPKRYNNSVSNLTTVPLANVKSKNDLSKVSVKKPERKEEFDNKKITITSKRDITDSAENNPTKNKTQYDFLSRLNMDATTIFDNISLFQELGIAKTEIKLNEEKKDAKFYPESPISELYFFKTPCSTRHNSLETFEQLENECIEDSIKQEAERQPENTSNILPTESFRKLPKEFQEMARRLSKKDSKKSSPSLHQVNFPQNFNCSSSTCSTISPRSPSGRKLFRTPSYKMPKTPSLSRQHPSTYVTQHTSSRSRPSSRVSSRASSPTREHIEALL